MKVPYNIRNGFSLLLILLAPCVSGHAISKTSARQNCVNQAAEAPCDDIFIEIISHHQDRDMNTIVTVRSPRAVKCHQHTTQI